MKKLFLLSLLSLVVLSNSAFADKLDNSSLLSDGEIQDLLVQASGNRSLCRCDCTDGQDGGQVERRDFYGSWSYTACNAKNGDSCTLSDGSSGTLAGCWRPTKTSSVQQSGLR
ncbi:MAG: hypothetical protein KDD64_13875 [Bdellovibrionales bacterium]|nr:hypothetical protein [Bdellovibrionales bacterium]